ncbi:MAG: helix-turn-helix transcriptional regulator [Oscillospiraceae bacterium]|nr:helix-turn-helix transcriptional regulator [Oscillospiraceae bacterium]
MYIHKMERNIYCPTEYGVNIFGGKWKPRVLCLLNIRGVMRYKEIKVMTPGITDNVLANVMKDLIAAQLVERKQYNEVPLRVEYSLTDTGRSLIPVLHSVCQWRVSAYGEEVAGTVKTCPYKAWVYQGPAADDK